MGEMIHGVLRFFFFFSSRRRHTRFDCDWSSDVCSSDLSDLFHSRLAIDNEARRTLDELLKRPGKSRDALAKLEEALSCASGRATAAASDKRWHEFTEFFNGVWSARRAALDRLFERYARVADWRAVCAIDADSILEERGRYANVRGKLPAGIELRAADASSTDRKSTRLNSSHSQN